MKQVILLLFLVASTSAAVVAAPTGVIQKDLETQVLPYAGRSRGDFAACRLGTVLVPVDGGIEMAGWHTWLVHPAHPAITSIACDSKGALYWIAGGKIFVAAGPLKAGSTPLRVALKSQAAHVFPLRVSPLHVITAPSALWVWGRASAGWALLHIDLAQGIVRSFAAKTTISAVATAGPNAVVVGLGNNVEIWPTNGMRRRLLHLQAPIDGLAVTSSGSLFVSTLRGIAYVDPSGGVRAVTLGIHGPLQMSGNVLYVLDSANSIVYRLSSQDGWHVPVRTVTDASHSTGDDLAERQEAIVATHNDQASQCETEGEKQLPLSDDIVQSACKRAAPDKIVPIELLPVSTVPSVATSQLPAGAYTFRFSCFTMCTCGDLSCLEPELKFLGQTPDLRRASIASKMLDDIDTKALEFHDAPHGTFGMAHQACITKGPVPAPRDPRYVAACGRQPQPSSVEIQGDPVDFVGEASSALFTFGCTFICSCPQHGVSSDTACAAAISSVKAHPLSPAALHKAEHGANPIHPGRRVFTMAWFDTYSAATLVRSHR